MVTLIRIEIGPTTVFNAFYDFVYGLLRFLTVCFQNYVLNNGAGRAGARAGGRMGARNAGGNAGETRGHV